jgi:hypothetical protein
MQAWHDDQARYGGRVTYLGGPGDKAHQARKSDHNCRQRGYHPDYAHALDTGIGGDKALGREIRDAYLQDPRVKYVIFDGVLYYPDGTTRDAAGHETHVHRSFKPGTTFDIRPFYGGKADDTMTDEQMATIGRWMQEQNVANTKATVEAINEVEHKSRRIFADLIDASGPIDRSKLTAETREWLAKAKVA